MEVWAALLIAAALVWGLKTAGYAIPRRFVEGALMSRVSAIVTVALLASLVASQTMQAENAVVLDARVPALAVAAGLLALRVPFLVVLLVAGAVAAGLRFFGILP